MLSPLPTPAEMSLWDKLTMEEFGLTGPVLMENASRGALTAMRQDFPSFHGLFVLVFAGPGNNGGDAFALARHLANEGAQVHIVHTRPISDYTGDTQYQVQLVQRMHLPCSYLPEFSWNLPSKPDLIVDGLLGTGFQGPLRPDMQSWIKNINCFGETAFVLSLDIPSGLDGLTGEAKPVAVKARTTVTFEAPKLGLFLPAAQPFVGQLVTVKIGIPEYIKKNNPVAHLAMTDGLVQAINRPDPEAHKGKFGHVLVLGGSVGLTGAPLLSARAAMRSGAGLVTIAGPKALTSRYACFPEVMTLGLGSSENWSEACADELKEHLGRFQCLALGPGLGRSDGACQFISRLLSLPRPAMVIDADALVHLSNHLPLMEALTKKDIVTPHPGEMSNFFGVSAPAINDNRLDYTRSFVDRFQPTVVLKGAGTVVGSPGQPLVISPFNTPNLAVAGSGDVLAGMMASLVSQGYPPLTAAMVAVYWHGLTGKLLAQNFPGRGNTPLEIADLLPQVLKEWNYAHC